MAVRRLVHKSGSEVTRPYFSSVKAAQTDCTDEDFETEFKRSRMKYELYRLQTYTNWPPSSNQLPERLAEAGLYYTGHSDRVQCPFCNGVLKNWNNWDVPMWEHRRHFPYCKFIRGKDVGNIAAGSASVNSSLPVNVNRVSPRSFTKRVDFTMEVNRLASFSKWPPKRTQTPESLARAGFYHIPCAEKIDRVMCAYCRGKLYNWRHGDDPWLEHARCYPACPYIQLCVGQEVISDLLR